MPHRAGYFALAYQWDHHCRAIMDSLQRKIRHILTELNELGYQHAWDIESLLNYYKKWHCNRELFFLTIGELERRRFIIESLGYRGYGVNRDLGRALDALGNEHTATIRRLLDERFMKHLEFVKATIFFPRERIEAMDSRCLISELCKKMGRNPDENIPRAFHPAVPDLGRYFRVMSRETSFQANTAVFRKMFLRMGSSSDTIMKGNAGYNNTLSQKDLKIMGNRNFLSMYREIFSNLHTFTNIGIDLLKRIHFVLSRDIDPDAGNFRPCDFSDRNGVTLENGNFDREIRDLSHVLWETGQSFHDLDAFIYNLSRSYYMLIGIHPFRDSNGRTGRCFLNQLFLKKGLPPVGFGNAGEIFALPRYGGSMEDMHEHIKARIIKAVSFYFFERWKLEHFGFLRKRIYNVSFDSGVHFRQIEGPPLMIEVSFQAFIADANTPRSSRYLDQCRIVLPDEGLLRNLTIYYGFSRAGLGEWEHVAARTGDFFIQELPSYMQGVRVFDMGFIVELQSLHFRYDYFNCCAVSPGGDRLFNNKGLNYSFRLEKP